MQGPRRDRLATGRLGCPRVKDTKDSGLPKLELAVPRRNGHCTLLRGPTVATRGESSMTQYCSGSVARDHVRTPASTILAMYNHSPSRMSYMMIDYLTAEIGRVRDKIRAGKHVSSSWSKVVSESSRRL